MTATTTITTGSAGTPTFVARDGEHDDAVCLIFRGVSVTITLRSAVAAAATGTDPDTVLVLIDTDTDSDTALSVQINDDPTWEGLVRA